MEVYSRCRNIEKNSTWSISFQKTEKPSVGPERNPPENQDESLQSHFCTDQKLGFYTDALLRDWIKYSRDNVWNFEVLERAGIPSVEEMVTTCQLKWIGHVTRMKDSRLPKAIFYGELKESSKKVRATKTCSKDTWRIPTSTVTVVEKPMIVLPAGRWWLALKVPSRGKTNSYGPSGGYANWNQHLHLWRWPTSVTLVSGLSEQ